MTVPRRSQSGTLVGSGLADDPGTEHQALLVCADDGLCSWVQSTLGARGWQAVRVRRVSDAPEQLRDGSFSLVILDRALDDSDAEAQRGERVIHGTALPQVVAIEDGAEHWRLHRLEAVETMPRPGEAGTLETHLAEVLLTRAAARAEAALAKEEEMRESDRLRHHLFERNPHPMWIYDLETLRFLAVNEAAVRKYGYSADEFLALTIRDIRPPEDVPRLLRSLREAPPQGPKRSGVWRHRTRDGQTVSVEILSHEIVFGGRRARLVIAHDVTERREIEEALRESEQRYRALFDQSPLGVLQFDRRLRVLTCNPRLATELGFADPSEVIGFDLSRMRDASIKDVFRRALQGERTAYEGPFYSRRARRQVWIALRLSPQHDADGVVQGGIAIIEDITQRREAEVKLAAQAHQLEQLNARLQERTQQLEVALQSRSRLYATMNHELRTPIAAVMLYSDLLLDGAMGPLTAVQADGVQHVQRSAQHLHELVQDVLDLARLEAGKLSVRIEAVRLSDVVHALADTIQPLAAHRGSELRLELAEPSTVVLTDQRRVRQIVLNLLSNAIRFGAGKPIVLGCSALPDGGAEITVADQGCGIAPEDQQRVFEDFVQVGNHREGGSGLGLSVSRRLAELLGGSLTLRSELGRGAAFHLTLPAAAPLAPDNLIRYALDATA
jgi:PAS domain S-box-containing protein